MPSSTISGFKLMLALLVSLGQGLIAQSLAAPQGGPMVPDTDATRATWSPPTSSWVSCVDPGHYELDGVTTNVPAGTVCTDGTWVASSLLSGEGQATSTTTTTSARQAADPSVTTEWVSSTATVTTSVLITSWIEEGAVMSIPVDTTVLTTYTSVSSYQTTVTGK